MSHDPAPYSAPGRAGGLGAIPRDRPGAGDAGRGPAGGLAAAGAGTGGAGAAPPPSPARRDGPDTERDGRRPPAPVRRCPAPCEARCRMPQVGPRCDAAGREPPPRRHEAGRGMISARSAVVLCDRPCTLHGPCSPAARSSPAHHPIRRARSRGLCHQKAPQENGQEEAPQAAEEDANPAPQQEVSP